MLLLVEVTEASSKEVKQKLEINPLGISNGFNKNEGHVVFGKSNFDEPVDVELNAENSPELGPYFEIYFRESENAYFMQDFGVGLGTYVKLYSPQLVNENCMINIGQTFIVAEIIDLQNNSLKNYTKFINESMSGFNNTLLSEQSIRLSVYNNEDKSSEA